jgi:propanediol dehydratase small subunit
MSIVAILVLLAVAWSALWLGNFGNPFRARTCQGRLWRRTFPAASKKQIRDFLSLFADAFAFRDTEGLKFRPDDQLLGIYRSLRKSTWVNDTLAFETFAKELRERYGVALDEIWNERMTLGALFAHVHSRTELVAQ